MGNQRISDLTPLSSGSLSKDTNAIPVVSGNQTFQTTLEDIQSDIRSKSLEVTGSIEFVIPSNLPGVWSTGGALNQARYHRIGGAGNKTSALAFGGYTYSTYIPSACTEAYDGSAWSVQNAMIQGRNNLAGFGTQDAAVAAGGNDDYYPSGGTAYSCTEEYNGSTWSAGTPLSFARSGLGGAGIVDAGLVFSGYDTNASAASTCTEEYDGSAWSTGGAISTARYSLTGNGTQNAALAAGGYTPISVSGCTETYDGVAWSAQTGLSVARYDHAASGTQNSALVFGGANYDCDNSYLNQTERWNGTSWSTDTPLSNGRYGLGGAGNSTGNSLAFGGFDFDCSAPHCGDCTEEYTDGDPIYISTFRYNPETGAVCSTGSFNGSITGKTANFSGASSFGGELSANTLVSDSLYDRSRFNGCVDLHCDVSISGRLISYYTSNFKQPINYTKTCFGTISAGPDLITGRQVSGGAGIQNAALAIGSLQYNTNTTCTEEYNGSTWAAGGALINNLCCSATFGTQNAALSAGGATPTSPFNSIGTDEYDGSTWSAGGSLNIARRAAFGNGTQNSGIVAGGSISAPSQLRVTDSEQYNGSTWSSIAPILFESEQTTSAGTSNALLTVIFRAIGTPPNQNYLVNGFDGTTWSYCPGFICTNGFPQVATGTQNDATAFSRDNALQFDGTGWSFGPNTSLRNRFYPRGSNFNTSGDSGILFGFGSPPTVQNTSDLYTNLVSSEELFEVNNSGVMQLAQVSSSLDFADDTAAAAGGVPLGGIYRNGGDIKIRLV